MSKPHFPLWRPISPHRAKNKQTANYTVSGRSALKSADSQYVYSPGLVLAVKKTLTPKGDLGKNEGLQLMLSYHLLVGLFLAELFAWLLFTWL